jgi:hypothetical protein
MEILEQILKCFYVRYANSHIFEFVWIWFSAIVFTQIFQRHILAFFNRKYPSTRTVFSPDLWNWIKCMHTWNKYSSHIKKMFDNISWVIDSRIHLQQITIVLVAFSNTSNILSSFKSKSWNMWREIEYRK